MYRIGEFARIAGVNPKTLRFYEACGILRPVRIDARTRYRFYAAHQLQDLALIRGLRAAGVSLAQIRRVIGAKACDEQRREVLLRLQENLKASLRQTTESLQWVGALLDASRRKRQQTPIVMKSRPALLVAGIRSEVRDYAEIDSLEAELLGGVPAHARGSFRAVLWHRCAAQGRPDGEPVVEIRRAHACRGDLSQRTLAPVRVASAYSSLRDEDAERAYGALADWMQVCSYELAGPKCEIVHHDALEIQFPVRDTRPHVPSQV